MRFSFTRRTSRNSDVSKYRSCNSIYYEIVPTQASARVLEEVFIFSNVEGMWLSPAQGEAVLEMAKPFTIGEETFLSAVADEEEIWICSDGTYTELHVMIDAFEYFEVL